MATSGTDGIASLCRFETNSVGQCLARGYIVFLVHAVTQCKKLLIKFIHFVKFKFKP